MRYWVCEECPMLNRDCESGYDCNLGYTAVSIELLGAARWVCVSTDCKLESYTSNGKTTFPETIEDEEVLHVYVPPAPGTTGALIQKAMEGKMRGESMLDSVFAELSVVTPVIVVERGGLEWDRGMNFSGG